MSCDAWRLLNWIDRAFGVVDGHADESACTEGCMYAGEKEGCAQVIAATLRKLV